MCILNCGLNIYIYEALVVVVDNTFLPSLSQVHITTSTSFINRRHIQANRFALLPKHRTQYKHIWKLKVPFIASCVIYL